jgi:hypothetical protein
VSTAQKVCGFTSVQSAKAEKLSMPTTHVLTNAPGNIWHLATPQGQVLDSVIAPNHAEAALAVSHLVPRDGVWEDGEDGRYSYLAQARGEVFHHARHH